MENYIKDYSSALYNLACLKGMPGKYIVRERIICILIYLGYSSAEVAKTICISTAGVVKAKQRIKRKIGLPTDVSLNEFITSV